ADQSTLHDHAGDAPAVYLMPPRPRAVLARLRRAALLRWSRTPSLRPPRSRGRLLITSRGVLVRRRRARVVVVAVGGRNQRCAATLPPQRSGSGGGIPSAGRRVHVVKDTTHGSHARRPAALPTSCRGPAPSRATGA